MACVCPFQGIRYNQSKIKDLSGTLCPPYDVISNEQQQELYGLSEYNFIRLEHGRDLPQDTNRDNKYTRAATTLNKWLTQAIVTVDKTPAYYLHEYTFYYQGKELKRCGLIAQVQLEDWGRRIIYPHEGTLSQPKSDRLNLLWALQATTSPILALYEDTRQKLNTLLARERRRAPVSTIKMTTEEHHRLWIISAKEVVSQIEQYFTNQPLYIADGHHRYESALTYRREKQLDATSINEVAVNYTLMSLIDFADPGLLILPPHRLVRGLSRSILHELPKKLSSFFEITKLPISDSDVWQRIDQLLSGGSESSDHVKLAMFGLDTEEVFFLRMRNFTAASNLMPSFHTELYKRLDVSVIDHIILDNLLSLGNRHDESLLDYSYDRMEAINRVRDGEYQLSFLISPVKPALIKAVATIGDRMPRKSTYFYPKEPAGLVFSLLK